MPFRVAIFVTVSHLWNETIFSFTELAFDLLYISTADSPVWPNWGDTGHHASGFHLCILDMLVCCHGNFLWHCSHWMSCQGCSQIHGLINVGTFYSKKLTSRRGSVFATYCLSLKARSQYMYHIQAKKAPVWINAPLMLAKIQNETCLISVKLGT